MRRSATVIALAMSLLALGLPAHANDDIHIDAPGSVSAGELIVIEVSVDGPNREGALIEVHSLRGSVGTEGWTNEARSVTDEEGVGVAFFEERGAADVELRVRITLTNGTVSDHELTVEVTQTGQLYRSEAGVRVPFLTGWWIIGLVAALWLLILYAVFRLVQVSRDRTENSKPKYAAVVLAGVVFGTAALLVTVLVRNPVTHSNLGIDSGYDRTDVTPLDLEIIYTGPGVSSNLADSVDAIETGRRIYIGAGCAGCHGLDGSGATVAGSVTPTEGELDAFSADVLRGPGGMPAYMSLSPADLNAIYEYLRSAPTASTG